MVFALLPQRTAVSGGVAHMAARTYESARPRRLAASSLAKTGSAEENSPISSHEPVPALSCF